MRAVDILLLTRKTSYHYALFITFYRNKRTLKCDFHYKIHHILWGNRKLHKKLQIFGISQSYSDDTLGIKYEKETM